MSEIKDGGPAFPAYERAEVLFEEGYRQMSTPVGGMSLRDWFAGQALPVIAKRIHLTETWTMSGGNMLDAARLAYGLADAMLKAREGK